MGNWSKWYRVIKHIHAHDYYYDQSTRKVSGFTQTKNRYLGKVGGAAVRASLAGTSAASSSRRQIGDRERPETEQEKALVVAMRAHMRQAGIHVPDNVVARLNFGNGDNAGGVTIILYRDGLRLGSVCGQMEGQSLTRLSAAFAHAVYVSDEQPTVLQWLEQFAGAFQDVHQATASVRLLRRTTPGQAAAAPSASTRQAATLVTEKPMTVYRGTGRGIGNTTFVSGKYYAETRAMAEMFGDVSEAIIPAGTRMFDFDAIKHRPEQDVIPRLVLMDPDATRRFLIDAGYRATCNTNTRGREFVDLRENHHDRLLQVARGFDNPRAFRQAVAEAPAGSAVRADINAAYMERVRDRAANAASETFGEAADRWDRIWEKGQRLNGYKDLKPVMPAKSRQQAMADEIVRLANDYAETRDKPDGLTWGDVQSMAGALALRHAPQDMPFSGLDDRIMALVERFWQSREDGAVAMSSDALGREAQRLATEADETLDRTP